ncbi:Hypothetical predicted protein [Cloeon dipterum]|uniref:Uncharacterized protein n=1 Tax=Cloeon dipterum TaxID=197152 RepID=A0A8S1EA76_9INSE|nr:Hypothetical predicted protein [Cloeon dipterum]
MLGQGLPSQTSPLSETAGQGPSGRPPLGGETAGKNQLGTGRIWHHSEQNSADKNLLGQGLNHDLTHCWQKIMGTGAHPRPHPEQKLLAKKLLGQGMHPRPHPSSRISSDKKLLDRAHLVTPTLSRKISWDRLGSATQNLLGYPSATPPSRIADKKLLGQGRIRIRP